MKMGNGACMSLGVITKGKRMRNEHHGHHEGEGRLKERERGRRENFERKPRQRVDFNRFPGDGKMSHVL